MSGIIWADTSAISGLDTYTGAPDIAALTPENDPDSVAVEALDWYLATDEMPENVDDIECLDATIVGETWRITMANGAEFTVYESFV